MFEVLYTSRSIESLTSEQIDINKIYQNKNGNENKDNKENNEFIIITHNNNDEENEENEEKNIKTEENNITKHKTSSICSQIFFKFFSSPSFLK